MQEKLGTCSKSHSPSTLVKCRLEVKPFLLCLNGRLCWDISPSHQGNNKRISSKVEGEGKMDARGRWARELPFPWRHLPAWLNPMPDFGDLATQRTYCRTKSPVKTFPPWMKSCQDSMSKQHPKTLKPGFFFSPRSRLRFSLRWKPRRSKQNLVGFRLHASNGFPKWILKYTF